MDNKLIEMANVMGMSKADIVKNIKIPTVMPFFRESVITGLGFAWKSGVAAEVIGLAAGSLGEALYESKVYYNTVDLFAWTVIIVLVSVIFERLIMWVLRRGFGALERL